MDVCGCDTKISSKIMEYLDPGYLRDMAIAFCIEHVYGWDTMTESEQHEHVQKTIDLLLERPEVRERVFANRLN
jgi:hypothetical protein